MGEKIDPNLWSDGVQPHLMGGKLPSGQIVFPMPTGDAAEGVEPYKLSRRGKLWSWTSQGFLPKEPYEGPGSGPGEGPPDFQPFLLGYVELPGEVIVEEGVIELNAGRRKSTLRVVNTGDRPVQIGSHYHFFEVNKALDFDRAAAFGMRLDIAAGTAVRFEPGQEKEVALTTFGGEKRLSGLNGLSDGSADDPKVKAAAIERARAAGFRGA